MEHGAAIRSEVGALQTVIIHRPDLELSRITPSNKDELLFDELIWLERAQVEHDAFADLMRATGAEVLYIDDLLTEVMADRSLADAVIVEHVTNDLCGVRLADRVRSFLTELPPERLVKHLIGGVTLDEVGATEGLVAALHGPNDFLLPPLPNAVFMRDSSIWIGDGVVLSPMNRLVRRRETDLLRMVYSHHPRFAATRIWFGNEPGEHFPASVEGGDVLVVGERGIAIGVSERTSPTGAAALTARLFEEGVVDRVLAVELPKGRSTMHLDTVVTMVDRNRFVLYPRIRSHVRALQVTPGPELGLHVEGEIDLIEGLAWAAGLDSADVIEPAMTSIQADREQWNDANNTFAVAPGEVIAYERNVATNEILEEAGVVVHRMPSYELPRGRGGPRCMTCPVARAPL
ncbi:MAG: arginine deiminase [Acidimicrobiia bacterium]|nr:arginine deiminase [Acidimicrobiia bacterium]